MSRTSLYFTLSASIFLASCGGSDSSSGNKKEVNEEPVSVICPSGETFEIDGIELITERYDMDNDGCLSDLEFQVATSVANEVLEQQEIGIVIDGVNSASGMSQIHSMKVLGSSEVSDSKIQLHTNIDSGRFHISLETYSTSSSNESLKLYFDDESAVGQSGTTPIFAMTFPLPPMVGDISYVFSCRYLSTMSVNCTTLVVTETDNFGSNIMTLDIDVTLSLLLNFSEQSLPQTGYIIATFCDESGDNTICFDNYSEISVSFN
jgi:hypothetical protein